MKYTIELNYLVSTTQVVEAQDEGEALDKARNKAEQTDLSDYVIKEEQASRILHQCD